VAAGGPGDGLGALQQSPPDPVDLGAGEGPEKSGRVTASWTSPERSKTGPAMVGTS